MRSYFFKTTKKKTLMAGLEVNEDHYAMKNFDYEKITNLQVSHQAFNVK